MIDILQIKTFGQLKASGYSNKSIKQEIRDNLIVKLKNKQPVFNGVWGYEATVLPDTERALLSKHNILYLGLRGQAKTKMARQMIDLLDEYIPIIAQSELLENPYQPISIYGKNMLAKYGDDMPIEWIHKSKRYAEKLATPDVSVADLIGDIDPIKAANLKLHFNDEQIIHYGIIPKSNRCIFVINELPDLQARIQVSLFNILQEGDLQIRGFKLQLPLDIMFVFTANPEDYTNRGSIVTPLKDRIESQILTHYPKSIEIGLKITEQEALVDTKSKQHIHFPEVVKLLIEQIAHEARNSELVDKKSGVSARLTISAYENVFSTAERRMILNAEKNTVVRISDLMGALPAIVGKIELMYEGEQEGALQVALLMLEKAIRTLFVQYFPNPELFRDKRVDKRKTEKPNNPYKEIVDWFNEGNQLEFLIDESNQQRQAKLHATPKLVGVTKQYVTVQHASEIDVFAELLLFGLSAYSYINKHFSDARSIQFQDLLGSMLGFKSTTEDEENDLT